MESNDNHVSIGVGELREVRKSQRRLESQKHRIYVIGYDTSGSVLASYQRITKKRNAAPNRLTMGHNGSGVAGGPETHAAI